MLGMHVSCWRRISPAVGPRTQCWLNSTGMELRELSFTSETGFRVATGGSANRCRCAATHRAFLLRFQHRAHACSAVRIGCLCERPSLRTGSQFCDCVWGTQARCGGRSAPE